MDNSRINNRDKLAFSHTIKKILIFVAFLMISCADTPEKAESNNPYYIPVNPAAIKSIYIAPIENKSPEPLADKLYLETLTEKLQNENFTIVDTDINCDLVLNISITRFFSSPKDTYDPVSTATPLTALGDALISKPVGEVIANYKVKLPDGKLIWAGSLGSQKEITPGSGNEYIALKQSVEATVDEFIRRLKNQK